MSPEESALEERVERYQDESARALLEILRSLQALEPSPERASAENALRAAARCVTFRETPTDRETPQHPHEFGATPTRPEGPLLSEGRTGLLGPLEDLLRELIFQADVQAYVDARLNAAAYLRAATHLARAAPFLRDAQ